MNCNDVRNLMPDVLGNEPPARERRTAFEDHLAECPACRAEYESYRKTVASLRELPGPKRVVLRREADRFVWYEAGAGVTGPRPIKLGGPLRYAASLLIAFTAGYAVHAGITITAMSKPEAVAPLLSPPALEPEPGRPSLHSAVARTAAGNPARSELAQCLIAMTPSRR